MAHVSFSLPLKTSNIRLQYSCGLITPPVASRQLAAPILYAHLGFTSSAVLIIGLYFSSSLAFVLVSKSRSFLFLRPHGPSWASLVLSVSLHLFFISLTLRIMTSSHQISFTCCLLNFIASLASLPTIGIVNDVMAIVDRVIWKRQCSRKQCLLLLYLQLGSLFLSKGFTDVVGELGS